MTPTFVLSLFSILILSVTAANPQCGAGELVCNDASMGPTCYDPNTYTCPSGSRGTILCGNQEHGPDGACGLTCYDMVDYVCCNEQLYNAYDNSAPCAPSVTPAATIPPPSDSIMCGSQRCLALYECCNDARMGPTCFDPNGASCPVGSQGPVLCGFQKNGADAACGTTCYDFHEYQCCNDQLFGIDETTPCSTAMTSAPTQAPTSLPTNAPTSVPTSVPTAVPTSVPITAPAELATPAGTIPPSPDSIMCGEQRCLALYECCNDTRMGPSCFDPNGASCPIGSQGPVLCGFQKNGADAACGTTCYDFHEYQCCNDRIYGIEEDTPCTPAPTNAPTQAPTNAPTQAPTQAPTEAPTAAPTEAPTSAPTQVPTSAGTVPPSGETSPAQTQAPTAAPTQAPTNSPTSIATIPPPSDSIMCGTQRCLALYECCDDVRLGPSCFDPNGASCPVGSQGPVLCGFQKNGADAACGTTCYDFHEYQCCNDQLFGIDETTPCSTGATTAPTRAPTAAPTEAPTSAPTQVPTLSGTIPPSGETIPAQTQAPTQAPTLAPTNAPTSAPTPAPTSAGPVMCGGQQCLALYECCNDTRMGPTCFDTNGASCPVGSQGPILCGFQKNGPDAACGTTCYDFHEYQCCDDKLYGIDETSPCSAPAIEMCGTSQCQPGLNCCNDAGLGPVCYDPSTYSCPVGSKGPILCGFQEQVADGTCGSVCYDMVDYKCCNDQLYGADDEDAPC